MKFLYENLYKFKSPWYYWYAGYKKESVICFFVCMVVSLFFLGVTTDFSPLLIAIFVLLDAAGFVLAAVYLLFFRQYFIDSIVHYFDPIVIQYFLIAFISSVVINRGVTYLIAYKLFKLPIVNGFSMLKEPNKSLKDAP